MRSTGLVVASLALVFLVNLSTAREDPDLFLPSQGIGDGVGGEKPWTCCDKCFCTKSIPPQCRCADQLIGGCHPNCETCACTKSYPPKCRCFDVINDYCGDSCNPEQ
ncbi:hypothetical protein OPV22_003061 [Ensete ventricosum]|uniref:Bowman-Birk serine protease inhibitors family domain-containing protein n=1 Tax=Ensete ventricosum TaxID=4639 RepID=A0AAV8RZJ9_ENSVE|nr:hypothetical protein OPV22_003061 [Ensete ventricosum]RWV94061.1 hypothetical protein GW17_00043439 [Ensete ventricosum]RZS27495.1 hypothetical protein BHM03_00060973 [Ensete ventricosum]